MGLPITNLDKHRKINVLQIQRQPVIWNGLWLHLIWQTLVLHDGWQSHMGLSIKVLSIHVFANKIVGSYRHNGVKQYKSFMSLGPRNQPPKTALMNLSVEEENLATIPFAVL